MAQHKHPSPRTCRSDVATRDPAQAVRDRGQRSRFIGFRFAVGILFTRRPKKVREEGSHGERWPLAGSMDFWAGAGWPYLDRRRG